MFILGLLLIFISGFCFGRLSKSTNKKDEFLKECWNCSSLKRDNEYLNRDIVKMRDELWYYRSRKEFYFDYNRYYLGLDRAIPQHDFSTITLFQPNNVLIDIELKEALRNLTTPKRLDTVETKVSGIEKYLNIEYKKEVKEGYIDIKKPTKK